MANSEIKQNIIIKQNVTHRDRTMETYSKKNAQEKAQKAGMGTENRSFPHSELYKKLGGNLYL